MTIDEAHAEVCELEKRIRYLNKFINEERTRNKMSNLEFGKYYMHYEHGSCHDVTFFQYTENCKYTENENFGNFLSVGEYITMHSTMTSSSYSFGNQGLISVDTSDRFEEISKEQFQEEYKIIIKHCKEHCDKIDGDFDV